MENTGNLRVLRGNSIVFNRETGNSYAPTPFAPSLSFVDVNGDGLPDLIVASPLGYLYWYPNIGKKGQPAFDHATIVQTYLGTAARIHAVDWNGDGKIDILFGNIEGDVSLLLNLGSRQEPQWVTSMGKPRWFAPAPSPHPQAGYQALKVMEGGEPIHVGNYSAPFLFDWNGDNVPDLLVGDGSYSANSIRIWLNTGTKANPVFKTESKFTLAYGDGREVLSPCVYDWNGDGIPDLVVSDRDGRITLYPGSRDTAPTTNKVRPLEPGSTLRIGSDEKLGYVTCAYVCDFNEDGRPDILYGTANGTLMVALGSGDKKNPTLLAGAPIKGVDIAKDYKTPSNWDNSARSSAVEQGRPWEPSCPIPQLVSIEDAPALDPREGKLAFQLSWYNQFFGWMMIQSAGLPGINNGFTEGVYSMNASVSQFLMGKEYELSFWRKGENMKISYFISYNEEVPNANDPKGPPRSVEHKFQDVVPVSSSWNQYRRTFRFSGTKEKHFDSNGKPISGNLELTFYGKGTVTLDDVRLVAVSK